MNKLNYLLPALASVMLASCSDEGPIEQISNKSFPLTIVFDGVTYNVDAKLQIMIWYLTILMEIQ